MKKPTTQESFFPPILYFPKRVRNRIIFGQWLDTQSGTKTGWQSAQAEMMVFSKAQVLTQFCPSPLMLMRTALENSVVRSGV